MTKRLDIKHTRWHCCLLAAVSWHTPDPANSATRVPRRVFQTAEISCLVPNRLCDNSFPPCPLVLKSTSISNISNGILGNKQHYFQQHQQQCAISNLCTFRQLSLEELSHSLPKTMRRSKRVSQFKHQLHPTAPQIAPHPQRQPSRSEVIPDFRARVLR